MFEVRLRHVSGQGAPGLKFTISQQIFKRIFTWDAMSAIISFNM